VMKRGEKVIIVLFALLGLALLSGKWVKTESSSYTPTVFSRYPEIDDMTTNISIIPRFSRGWGDESQFYGLVYFRKGNDRDPVMDVEVKIKRKYWDKDFTYLDSPDVLHKGRAWISNLVVENDNGDRFILIDSQKKPLDLKDNKWLKFKGFHGERLNINADIHYLNGLGLESTYQIAREWYVDRRKTFKPALFSHRE